MLVVTKNFSLISSLKLLGFFYQHEMILNNEEDDNGEDLFQAAEERDHNY